MKILSENVSGIIMPIIRRTRPYTTEYVVQYWLWFCGAGTRTVCTLKVTVRLTLSLLPTFMLHGHKRLKHPVYSENPGISLVDFVLYMRCFVIIVIVVEIFSIIGVTNRFIIYYLLLFQVSAYSING